MRSFCLINEMEKVLIIEDKKSMADMLKRTFEMEGFFVKCAYCLKDGYTLLNSDLSVVITDLKLPDGDGLEIVKNVNGLYPHIPVIVMTAYGSIELAVKAVKDGAYDFITKPFDPEHLLLTTKRAISEKKAAKENLIFKKEFNEFLKMPNVIGESSKWQEVIEKVKRVASLKTTVLILGESGTGKEIVARTIHYLGSRAKEPFIAINCAAIPKDLVESELFGYEKGAFTGANETHQGRFELANKGTIFLDEIGDMDGQLQAKLLRVLEDGELQRVGGTKSIKIDVRVIAASNKDLKKLVEDGKFREDLFFRLNVFPIVIPPLRERREDIIPLAEHFLRTYSIELKKEKPELSEEVKDILLNYDWKGNVRELKNVIERALILCDGSVVLPEHLNLSVPSEDRFSLHDIKELAIMTTERLKIEEALKKTKGNKSKAAEILKVSYKTLLNKIKEYGIKGYSII